jgi:hypothetical protein
MSLRMIAAVNIATSLQGFLSENILRAAKSHQIKISDTEKLSHDTTSSAMPEQRKSPDMPGFSDGCIFRSAHLASLAI